MDTLSYGYLKPTVPDKGPEVFPALEGNWERVNDHNHDGSNSARLPVASVEPSVQDVLAAAWVDLSNGNYRQLVTCPAGVSFDETVVQFRTTTGHVLYLSVERVSEFTYYVYINDNTLSLKAFYTS